MDFLTANSPTSWGIFWLQPLLVMACILIVLGWFGQTWNALESLTGSLVRLVDGLNTLLAQSIKWLALTMVLMVSGLVIMRYVFGISAIKAQESVIYMHAFLFLLAAPAALLTDTHVRVDVFYEKLSIKGRAIINLVGTFFLLMPVCILIFKLGGAYAARAWVIFEGSPESDGIQAVFLLKTAIPVFAMFMMLQGSAMAARAAMVLSGKAMTPSQETGVIV